MMTPTVLTKEQVDQRKVTLFGNTSDLDVMVSDALRAEIWARRVTTRRSVCDHVARLLQPIVETDTEHVRSVLDHLEQVGDVTSGPRGQVAAAPLRAISVAPNRHLIAGGPDSAALASSLAAAVESSPDLRAVNASPGFEGNVAAAGGICLSAEEWAGLNRAPPADEQWLELLGTELHHQGRQPDALPEECGPWSGLVPNETGKPPSKRWLAVEKAAEARLWRAWHEHGYWFFAWTAGGPPSTQKWLRVSADQANRAFFALHSAADQGVHMDAVDSGQDIELDASVMLPKAEYRYLLTVGRRADRPGLRYRVPKDAWSTVVSLFESRLGVVFEHRGAT